MRTDEQNAWAVVTGASSGLGRDFSLQLAQRGYNLVLVARRADRLEELAREIDQRYRKNALPVALDLTAAAAVTTLLKALDSAQIDPEVLINNAGFGLHGGFLEYSWPQERSMLELDILALVELTRAFATRMIARGRGYILQVASIAAYQSSPSYAGYAAAKSYVLHYGEAINEELRGSGVSCTVLSPGVTKTEFLEVAGQRMTLFHRLTIMESERVVRVGLRALLKRRASVVPGLANKVAVSLNRLMPRRAVVRVVRRLMGFSGGAFGARSQALSALRSAMETYRADYPDEGQTVSRFLTLLEQGPAAFYRDHAGAHFTASAVVMSPDRKRVLLTHHRKLDIWIQLGGHADGDPDLIRAAEKEAIEESGIAELELGSKRIVDIDIHPIPAHGSEPPHEHFDVRFLFIASPDAVLTVSEESHDLAWVAVDRLSDYSTEASLTRLIEKAGRVLK